ncbi:MAG: hypothetical protein Q9214_004937, partial [Letrouitia sp. 1 TL-2023]
MTATPPPAPPASATAAAAANEIFSSSGPPPNLTATRIDFSKTDLPEYAPSYALLIDHAFSQRECAALLAAAEASRSSDGSGCWEKALVNVAGGRQRLMPEVRDCGRIIWDDEDVVAGIWERVKECVEEDIGRLV